MTILRTGATKQYSDNWAAAFGEGKRKKATAKATAKTKTAKTAKKKAAKKKAKKA